VGLLSLAFGYGAEGLAMGAGFGIIMEFFTEPIYRHYASRLLNAQETYLNQLKVSPQYREAASHIPELPGVVSDTRKMLAYFKRSV